LSAARDDAVGSFYLRAAEYFSHRHTPDYHALIADYRADIFIAFHAADAARCRRRRCCHSTVSPPPTPLRRRPPPLRGAAARAYCRQAMRAVQRCVRDAANGAKRQRGASQRARHARQNARAAYGKPARDIDFCCRCRFSMLFHSMPCHADAFSTVHPIYAAITNYMLNIAANQLIFIPHAAAVMLATIFSRSRCR